MMMTFGMFVFGLDSAAYQELQRQTVWRHAGQNRIGRKPVRQYLGQGDDTITLTGVLLPQFTGGQQHLDELRQMADEGAAWPLIEGSGYYYGLYVIESLSETKSHHTLDGTAQRIGFTLSLAAVDDDRPDLLGQINNTATRTLLGLV